MPFLSLSVCNFRNLQNETLNLLSKEVFFVGENGQGKSNLLEAIYYSAYATSFRTKNESEIATEGTDSFSLRTMYKEESGKTSSLAMTWQRGKKKIEKNGKAIKDRKDLINTVPCVLFNHDDLDFAVGEPERRRFFIDQSLSMFDGIYLDSLRKYKRILKSRNQMLKDHVYELLDVYDLQMVQEGLEIQKKRAKTILQFNELFADIYEKVTGIDGVHIQYEPSWKSDDMNVVLGHLQSRREAERAMETTLSGPHRDKIVFIRNGKPFIATASTGQRRLTALVLRIAQATYYTRVTGKKPVLLMDDVLLEMDPDKRQRVTMLLPDYDQLFCTFLNGEPYDRYAKSTTTMYHIENGVWQPMA
ncbi:MAG: DNA replication and repair protein RecF [Treponemataceae bacterium]|nr:DNA replication and repair protein RecF [Treponemataceae bacterium]